MRFLMFTTFYPPYSFGGDASYLQRLVNELARRGHGVDVVHCAEAYHLLQRGDPPKPVSHPAGVTVHALHSEAGWFSPLLTQQTGRAMLKAGAIRDLATSTHFDVIHYHNMSLIGLDTIRFGTAVKLYTTHEHWLVCPMHVLWRNNREVCTKRTCFSCQIVSHRPPQWWRYGRLAERCLADVDCFISPSRFTLEKHRALGFTAPMVQLPYFVPLNDDPGPAGSPHARPYALIVGRLEKIKGVHNVIRAFRDYRGCDLIIVGDGAYETELRKTAGGSPHVEFLGRLPYEQIRAWYRHALALVVPSICYEVFGIVMLEAFSMGTPALVTPMGALPEIIEDSGGGVVYRSDQELIGMLERLQNEPGLRDELGRAGNDAYRRLWSETTHLERYFEIIRQAADGTVHGHAPGI